MLELYLPLSDYYLPTMNSRSYLIAASLILSLLCGCSSVPREEETGPRVVSSRGSSTNTVNELLRRADRASGSIAAEYELEAAQVLYTQDLLPEAEALLVDIELAGLPAELVADILLLRGDIMLELDDPRLVLELLQSSNLPSLISLDQNRQLHYHRLRAQAYYAIDAMLSSALERMQMDRMLSGPSRQNNHELIWEALGALPLSQLQAMVSTAINFEARGWYELALLSRQYDNDLDRQLVELRRWRDGWGRHPAADMLPAALEQVALMARERPRSIALLLPLQTAEGIIVRDAFMSAYFNLLELGGQVPDVRMYDASSTTDIYALHQQAVQEGAQLIIGPLLKEHVAVLQQISDLGVPTLALNNIEGSTPASRLLYQFSLSPEDEARQLAGKAWRDGHRRLAILHPQGETRRRDSFVDAWLQLGGTVVSVENFRDSYTDVISRMLELDKSNARHTDINNLMRAETTYIPRRRHDIDSLLLIAPRTAARQIVPSLAYLYAGDIPVYASQEVYAGVPSPVEDRDLNGVIFGESPWLLGTEDTSMTRARELFPFTTARTLRLQAFGIDAFRLYPRLNLLGSSPNAILPGASGTLRMGEGQNIIRQLTWTRFRDGMAVVEEQQD